MVNVRVAVLLGLVVGMFGCTAAVGPEAAPSPLPPTVSDAGASPEAATAPTPTTPSTRTDAGAPLLTIDAATDAPTVTMLDAGHPVVVDAGPATDDAAPTTPDAVAPDAGHDAQAAPDAASRLVRCRAGGRIYACSPSATFTVFYWPDSACDDAGTTCSTGPTETCASNLPAPVGCPVGQPCTVAVNGSTVSVDGLCE